MICTQHGGGLGHDPGKNPVNFSKNSGIKKNVFYSLLQDYFFDFVDVK